MGMFNRRSNEQARIANPDGTTHLPPAGANQTYPSTENGYASHPDPHGKNNGPLGNHGAVTGNHTNAPGAAPGTTHGTGPAPLHGVNSPGSSPRSSAESRGTEREAVRLARKGKTKNTMGSLLCNSRMKREGEQLQAQSEHLKMQASELNEAARLEHEAGMRRQRAVGMGADPVLASGTTGFAPSNPTARA